MNQPNEEASRLTQEADGLYDRCKKAYKEAIQLFNEAGRIATIAKSSFFGRSKLLADASRLGDEGKKLQEEARRLKEEGDRLMEQAKKLQSSEPVSDFVTCRCQHCDTGIEFNAAELGEENSIIPCPHCGVETKLYVPQSTAVPAEADAPQKQKADFSARVEAEKPEREAQLQKLREIADRRLIYSQLDSLKLEGDCVKIHRRGIANALAAGLNGERTILISSLTSVQMKPAAWLSPGYILFSYAGSKPFMGGIIDATQDPDAFIFGQELNGEVAEFKTKVEEKMRESRRPAPASNSSGTLTDEIRKLAELKQQGLLSQEEFEAAKRKLFA